MTTLSRVVINGKEALVRTVVVSNSEKITNLNVATPNSEVSHALQDGIIKLIVRPRSLCTMKIAFTSGESGTKYVTINPGTVFELDEIYFTTKTLYLQTSISTVVEIMELYTT